ncbi:aldehyde-activating protein [Bacterioplanes sanyensis]|uniref:Aldehyde-activating protein n=1 Tax=Bacterioplanes sanyensis TaxID=1249553 RepID=A0A222FG11_9GAMM|nr:GFA family protein [Bacterioplanes sanyensis]ASP37572.1 aldehyde-activating protein [Bacterioplanes sanyensis]
MSYHGSCLCGDVQVTIDGLISSIIHCHCSLCRKSSGSAYATNGFINAQDFTITQGQDKLAYFELRPGKKRHFCRRCASPIYSSNQQDPDRLRIRLGLLDGEIQERPCAHIFVTSKAGWEDLDADIPRYSEHEPGR